MAIVLRYAFLLALGFGGIVAFVSAMSETGSILIQESGEPAGRAAGFEVWILAGMAALSLFSLIQFTFSRVPSFVRGWFSNNWDRLATVVLVVLFGAVFLVA